MLLKKGSSGQPVKDAQWLMAGHNRFKIETYRGHIDGHYGDASAAACRAMKFRLGYPKSAVNGHFGDNIYKYLIGKKWRSVAMMARARAREQSVRKKVYYPLSKKGRLIGWPGIGTHSWSWPPNNWESDNAVDISIPVGTPVLAYKSGKIGAQIGPLPDPNPRFHGNRLHLHTDDGNEFYYAHLTDLKVHAYQDVKAGQVLGHSGTGNGVPHLHWASKRGNPQSMLKGL